MTILMARQQQHPVTNPLVSELRSSLENNIPELSRALTRLLTAKRIATFYGGFSNSEDISDLPTCNNLDDLRETFKKILFIPFGMKVIDSRHKEYLRVRDMARRTRNNELDGGLKLFEGTVSRDYQHAFSNHAYTFGYFLSINQDAFNQVELKLIMDLFYYVYLKERFHSFCEIDAAFIRASEDFHCPTLRGQIETGLPMPLLSNSSLNLENHEAIVVNTPCALLDQFDVLFKNLKRKTLQLQARGLTNPKYEKVANIAKSLNLQLTEARQHFFESPAVFKRRCVTAIQGATKEFAEHRGFWGSLNSFIVGLKQWLFRLGVLIETDATKKLRFFQQGLDKLDFDKYTPTLVIST